MEQALQTCRGVQPDTWTRFSKGQNLQISPSSNVVPVGNLIRLASEAESRNVSIYIGALAERIEEFSFGGAKFTWKKKLEEGKQIIEHAPVPKLPKPDEPELPLEVPAAKPPTELAAAVETTEAFRARQQARRTKRWKRNALRRVLSGLDEIDTSFKIHSTWFSRNCSPPSW